MLIQCTCICKSQYRTRQWNNSYMPNLLWIPFSLKQKRLGLLIINEMFSTPTVCLIKVSIERTYSTASVAPCTKKQLMIPSMRHVLCIGRYNSQRRGSRDFRQLLAVNAVNFPKCREFTLNFGTFC